MTEIIFTTMWCLTMLGWLYSLAKCDQERLAWQKERKDLMDRIQAPSFAEYTNKVIREKKAEQPQEEEKPIEFVS